METISLKMEPNMLGEIDKILRKNRYSTRTEFIRDAIRTRLKQLETEAVIRRLAALKGSMKGKTRMSDEEAGEIAFKNIARKHGIYLN